jgi:prepilin peptidase CpaA
MEGVPFPVGLCVLALVAIAALWDVRTRRIPNWLVATALVVALPVQWFVHGGTEGLQLWAGGCLAGGLMFLPGYLMRLMGAGDVKLIAAVGAFCGASGAFEIALVTCVVGGVWALATLVIRRQTRAGLSGVAMMLMSMSTQPASMMPRETERTTQRPAGIAASSIGTLPYGVAIAVGATLVLFASV